MTTGRIFTSRAPMMIPKRTRAMGFALRLSNTSARGGAMTMSSCAYRCGSLGQSLSDGAFLDGGSRSFCFRNGRFSIVVTTLFVTLAFICYNETIQVPIFIRVRLTLEVLLRVLLRGHVSV